MSIEILTGDIVNARTDAVVNAANERLKMGSGVCGAIFRTAGIEKLTQECDRIGKCETGDAVVTDAFDLEAKYIIHGVGPRYCGGRNGEAIKLFSCYRKALELAKKKGCRSIAFPLVSAGIFGYPVAGAWEIALLACRDEDIEIKFMVLDERIKEEGLWKKERMEKNIACFDNDTGVLECFSNWYHAPFVIDGETFSSIETYMMIKKVELFGEYELADMIRKTDDPAMAKKIGRSPMKHFDDEVWKKEGYAIVKKGVRAKFEQYPMFAEILKKTEGMIIAECNEEDSNWGIGISLDDERRYDRNCWNGENKLGNILMEIREEIL